MKFTAHRRRIALTITIACMVCAVFAQEASATDSTSIPSLSFERMAEWSIDSKKTYVDPFNDVDIDVIFERGGRNWRVPTFWRGGNRWTVRFAPPEPGVYHYHLESTDKTNPDLNGRGGSVRILPYRGENLLLKHGMIRVSSNHRFFEQQDGTPFYWLGDTWWMGLSDRLPWDGFQELSQDRKEKGFTVVQICAGLVPSNEELAPTDPGFCNEGGCVWDSNFRQINPTYFDYADRRIQNLIDAGIAPAIVGGWRQILKQISTAKMEKHWRYIIARYGAYPVFWIGGGEVYDPPEFTASKDKDVLLDAIKVPGWTEIIRYIRATDPYHHPLTVHEVSDVSLQDPLLTDFDLAQPSHFGWASIGNEVAQLNMRYARTEIAKPFVVGEIGYEMLGGTHLEDFQRVAFWLAMLNGAAGHTYGSAPTFEVNNPEKPLHRAAQYTFLTWKEGMNLPGSYQVGINSKLLRSYPWWQLVPHPDWITPHGTTLLEPRSGVNGFDLGGFQQALNEDWTPTAAFLQSPESTFPGGEWKAHMGNFRLPYAAGIPGKLRLVYIPYFGLFVPSPPTVLQLEVGVRYHSYYWEPMLGIKVDLGTVEVPAAGPVEFKDSLNVSDSGDWSFLDNAKVVRGSEGLMVRGSTISVVNQINASNIVVAVDALDDSDASLLLRYQDPNNYIAATYSAKRKALYLWTRVDGQNSLPRGFTPVSLTGRNIRLRAEVRSNMATAQLTDGRSTYSTPIVETSEIVPPWFGGTVKPAGAGKVGLLHEEEGSQHFGNFEVRRSPTVDWSRDLDHKMYDARGVYRGQLSGPGWDDFGKGGTILLNSYRPDRFPTTQDWVLVLDAIKDDAMSSIANGAGAH